MWGDDQILDTVAGKIDAPCQWRLQLWILISFSRWSVAMLEGDANCAAAYLWILSLEQSNSVVLRLGTCDISGVTAAPFDLEEVRELSPAQANYWGRWPFFRVGDVVEEIENYTRDGIWITMRLFDGFIPRHADLTNPDEKWQPLRWQVRREVFELLSQIWDWQTLMNSSNLVMRRRK